MPKPTKINPITIHLSDQLLTQLDSCISNPTTREQFILDVLKAHFRRSLQAVASPPKVVKAIAESTATLKTGRYEP